MTVTRRIALASTLWFVSLVIDPDRRSKDVVAGGVVEYVPASQALSAMLKDAGKDGALSVLSTDMEGRKANPPELLLAPAGSPEALVAAVNAGADAIYLGGKCFGARMYAANFSHEELEAAVAYAHTRRAKVYLTLNILIHDRELPDAARYLVALYQTGVDGVLVQDVRLATLARELVPGLPLHASTQCTLTDEDGLIWAGTAGFERVALARELSLAEIDRLLAIPDRPGIEIFVHGALCYAYSGQCLLSSVIGGRSGNRGRCAQPCRKPYRLVAGTEGPAGRIEDPEPVETPGPYLLSTKDLCLLASLPHLVARPIDALKIEGRMWSAEYVAIVVSRYRRAIDDLVAGRGPPDAQDEEDLAVHVLAGVHRRVPVRGIWPGPDGTRPP